MFRRIVVLVFAVSVLSACETSLSGKKYTASSSSAPAAGLVYRIPQRVFDVEVSTELKDCRVEVFNNVESVHIEIVNSAKVESTLIPNPEDTYLIEYEALSASTKITSATFELTEDGFLKSINATIDDKSSEIAAASVGALLSIARVSAGLPPAPVTGAGGMRPAPKTKVEDYCKPEALVALQTVRSIDASISALKKAFIGQQNSAKEKLANATTGVKKAEAALTAAKLTGDEAKIKAANAALGAAKNAEKSAQQALASVKLSPEVPKLQARRTAIMERRLRYSVQTRVVPDKDGLEVKVIPFGIKDSQSAVLAWLTDPMGKDALNLQLEGNASGPQNIDELFSFEFHLEVGAAALADAATDCADEKCDDVGVLYRNPIPAIYRVCLKGCNESGGWNKAKLLAAKDTSLPQFGPLASLTLRNGAFQKNTINAVFAATGNPTKVEYNSEKAMAEELSRALDEAGQKYLAYQEGARQAEIDAVAQERKIELDELQHRVDVATKEREAAEAEAALQGSP